MDNLFSVDLLYVYIYDQFHLLIFHQIWLILSIHLCPFPIQICFHAIFVSILVQSTFLETPMLLQVQGGRLLVLSTPAIIMCMLWRCFSTYQSLLKRGRRKVQNPTRRERRGRCHHCVRRRDKRGGEVSRGRRQHAHRLL